MPGEPIRAVFDCNVFWQIFFSNKGIAAACWELVTDGTVELFVSRTALDEIQDVLTRPETRARFSKATSQSVAAFLDEILENATFVDLVESHFTYRRDPKDEPYINLAVEAKADYIISRDKDLLDLMTGFDEESKQFRQRFRPLAVIEPLALLEIAREAEAKN
jgi:putative PIN family toxin of toxin-antitoxin system